MTRKSLIAILAIFIIPLAAFWGMTFNKDTSVVALASMEKPHIYKFSSTMCLECKEVEKIFKEIMPKYEEKIDYTSIIVDKRSDMKNPLIKKFGIKLVPTVIMLNTDGTVSSRIEGARSKEDFEECIGKLK